MKKQFSAIAITGLCAFAAASAQARTVGDFCDAWEFSRDQRSWRAVEVPHDWAVEGPFEPEGENATGKLPWKGVGYYRKTIVLDAAPEGRVFLDTAAVYLDDADVFVSPTVDAKSDGQTWKVAVKGLGKIVSVGNSNPRGLDSFKDVPSHPLYNGRAGLYIRRTGPGKVRLTAAAEGLKSATLSF